MNPLLSLLGSSENTWQYAKDYLFYIAIGICLCRLQYKF